MRHKRRKRLPGNMDVLWSADSHEEGAEREAGAALASRAAVSDDKDVDEEEEDYAPELGLMDAFAVPPDEVRARIERACEDLARSLLAEPPSVPALELKPRTEARAEAGGRFLPRKRLLHSRDGASTVRLWRVLAECHANLLAGRSATQRELYYALADGQTVRKASEVNAAIQDATRLLRVPRSCLAVTCASRGSVAGALSIKENNVWADLSASRGRAIPGSVEWAASAVLRSDARYILVVEKDAVFNRLLQEHACERMNAIMLTARGQPDLATRAFLHRLSQLLPDAPVLALVDWNPSGVLILTTYRHGSATRMAMDAGRYDVDVKWLAARDADLAQKPDEELLPLTARDRVLLRNLLAGGRADACADELQAMARRDRKAELESIYDTEHDLTPALLPKILRGDFV